MKKFARIFIGAALLIAGIYALIFAVNGCSLWAGSVGGGLVAIGYMIAYEGGG